MIDQMILEAERICRTNDRVLPRHLRQSLTTWVREGMSIDSVWGDLKNALALGLPIEPLDILIRKRHADKIAIQDKRLRESCPRLTNEQRYVRHEWPREAVNHWQGFPDE
jgi:hypothetical protein